MASQEINEDYERGKADGVHACQEALEKLANEIQPKSWSISAPGIRGAARQFDYFLLTQYRKY